MLGAGAAVFVFEDHVEEPDVMELFITNRNLQFADDPLFQERNEIAAVWPAHAGVAFRGAMREGVVGCGLGGRIWAKARLARKG